MVSNDNPNNADRESRWNDLMRAGQGGDKVAYEQLLSEMVPVLRRIIARRWNDRDEIDDIVQNILISVHSVRHTYDPARPIMPWLMTITRRRIADTARKNAVRYANELTVDVMPETFPITSANLEQETIETADEIRHALSGLPAAQREAVELMKVRGLSLKEASAVTGKSVASLKVTVHRAMKAMRQVLE